MLVYILPLQNKFIKHISLDKEEEWAWSSHLSELVLPFLSVPLEQMLLHFWLMPVNPHFVSCDYLLQEFWVSGHCRRFWNMLTEFFFRSSLSNQAMNLATIWHIQILFWNALKWTRWNSQHVSIIRDSDSNVFLKYLHLIRIFICFVCWWMSWAFSIFTRGHTAF